MATTSSWVLSRAGRVHKHIHIFGRMGIPKFRTLPIRGLAYLRIEVDMDRETDGPRHTLV